MRMMTNNEPRADKAEAIALLSSMQSSLRQRLALPPTLEHHPVPCWRWRTELYVVAMCSRSAGLHAHSSVSLRIGEQLEPVFRSADLPRWAVELFLRWSDASLRYLRHSGDFRDAAALVGLLSRSGSPDYYSAKERACLLRNLIEDHESDAERSAREAADPGSCFGQTP